MLLIKLINKSAYGVISYISSEQDLETLERYILYNLSVLTQFKQIIVATNYKDLALQGANKILWEKYFPNCVRIDSGINRGHNHGNADLDNLIVDYCKKKKIKWLCKSANDVIIDELIIHREVGNADFYYLNGIGYGGMVKYGFDFDRIVAEDFYPQTNFYFINVSKIDYLNDKEYLDKTYKQIIDTPDYNGRIWEYISGWSCEDFLKQCVQRNKLTKEHLLMQDEYLKLLHIVKEFNIHDCSHKNIWTGDVCHFAYPDQNVIVL
jgi:hypothetical protein